MSSEYVYQIRPEEIDDYIRALQENMVQESIRRKAANSSLVAKFRGDDRTSPNLTCNVYKSPKGHRARLYSTDIYTILEILAGRNPYLSDLPVVQLDDSGWGSPVGGTLIGAIGPGGYHTRLVPIELHEEGIKTGQLYTHIVYLAEEVLKLATNGSVDQHVIEICPSHVFAKTRSCLKDQGLTFRTASIRGSLQQRLRSDFLAYLADLGVPHNIADKSFPEIQAWAMKNERTDLIKWR